MSFRWIILILALPAAALADAGSFTGSLADLSGQQAPPPPPPPGAYRPMVQNEVPVEACPEDFGARAGSTTDRLGTKTQEAVQRVEAGLSGLNNDMARKILAKIKAKKIRVACGVSSGLDGGQTEFEAGGKVKITIYMAARQDQYSLEARIFHELIHAVDPDNKYILSAAMHSRDGFPDPVYGCQFALFNGVGADEIDRVNNYERSNGLTIPQLESYSCQGGDCATLRKYAYLCSSGKPLASGTTLDAASAQKAVECIMDGILNKCELKACADLRAKADAEMERNNGNLPSALRKELKATGGRLYQAGLEKKKPSELEEGDRELYKAAFKAGFLKETGPDSCLK